MLKAIWRLFILPSQNRRRRRQLSDLNEHILKDIGLEPENRRGFSPPLDPTNWR